MGTYDRAIGVIWLVLGGNCLILYDPFTGTSKVKLSRILSQQVKDTKVEEIKKGRGD